MQNQLLNTKIAYFYEGEWQKAVVTKDMLSTISNFEVDGSELTILVPNDKFKLLYRPTENLWYSSDPDFADFVRGGSEASVLSLGIPEAFSTPYYGGYTPGGSGGTGGSGGSSTAEAYTGGTSTKHSALDETLGFAPLVRDLDDTTYETIGIGGIRYIMQDFGGNLDKAVPVMAIEWVVKCDRDKTYSIEAWDGLDWTKLVSAKVYAGENRRIGYRWSSPQYMYAVRIYYTGNYDTPTEAVTLAISSKDDGTGTTAYMISNFEDFRDATSQPGADVDGWVALNGDGIFYKSWNLTDLSALWETVTSFSGEIITSMFEFENVLIIGTESGKVYYSTDGSAFTLAKDYASPVNCICAYDNYVYIGLDNGSAYKSANGTTWPTSAVFTITPTTVDPLSYHGILSMTVFNSKLYIGTDYKTLHSWDGSSLTLARTFLDHGITALTDFTDANNTEALWFGTEPSGKIYRTSDGSAFSEYLNTDLASWSGGIVFSYNNHIFMYGDKGQIYEYDQNKWSKFYDTSADNITSAVDFIMRGPVILDAYEDGSGDLLRGTYKYAITYIDFDDQESLIGDVYDIKVYSNSGRVVVTWDSVPSAKSYRIYRTNSPDVSESYIRLLAEGIVDVEYTDDGSVATSSQAVPSSSKSYLWFLSDGGFAYVYDGTSVTSMQLITSISSGTAMVDYRGTLYIAGYDPDDLPAGSTIRKYVGTIMGTGTKRVFLKTKDALDNESEVFFDDIYLSNRYENAIIEINPSGEVVDIYESSHSPPFKFISPHKDLYREGIYESEYFYVSELSRWDKAQYLIFLPDGSEFDLYVRTSDTREGLDTADWFGPATEENPVDPGYDYDFYYDYDGDNYYTNQYDVYYSYHVSDPGNFATGSLDISTLRGKWIQFKIILRTYEKYLSPMVYSIVIRYISTNAVRFFTTLFDLETLALQNYDEDVSDVTIRRGILTYNGSIPDGGKIEFGITTRDSVNWSDYQIIQPNSIFEIEDKTQLFRVGILLVSTPLDIAIVHEWAIEFDTGEKRVYLNT